MVIEWRDWCIVGTNSDPKDYGSDCDVIDERGITSTLIAHLPIARTDLRTKSTSTSVAYLVKMAS